MRKFTIAAFALCAGLVGLVLPARAAHDFYLFSNYAGMTFVDCPGTTVETTEKFQTSPTNLWTTAPGLSISANERDGYRFLGWYTKNDGWNDDETPTATNVDLTPFVTTREITYEQILTAGKWTSSQYPTIVAKYIPIYSVTTAVSPAGKGTVSGGGTYDMGAKVTLSASVTDDAYRISHWEKDGVKVSGSDNKASLSITVTEGAAYTVVLVLKKYSVTFHDPSGTYGDVVRTVQHGQSATAPAWSRTGYGLSWSASFDKITANATVNAQWAAKGYKVTFNANGGSTPSPSTKNVTYDSTYGTLATSTRTGYTFAGWWTAASGGSEVKADTKVQITAAQTLYAHWTPIVYTITYSGLKQGATHQNPATYTIETPTITFTPPTAVTGFTFSGWSLASIAQGTKTGNQTVTASYLTWIEKPTPAQYELAYNGGRQTIASGNNMAASGHQEAIPGTYTAKFTPNSGYCWSDGTTASYSFKWCIVNADITGIYVQQNGSLTYNGEEQQPQVYSRATVKGSQTATWKFSKTSGDYAATMPSFTDAGTYTVYYEVSAQYHNSVRGSFTVSINRASEAAIIVSPTHLPYSKMEQGPTVTLRHCHEVAGSVKRATAVGTYVVKVEPDANYAWSNGETAAREVGWSIDDSLYTVQFDGNGGAGEMASTNLAYNEEYVVPECLFTKTGCEFQHWQVLIDGRTVTNYPAGTVVSNLTSVAGKDVTFKADWKGYYTIAFDGNGATNTVMASQLLERDVMTNLSANAYRRTGYGFLGWDDANGKRYADGAEVLNLAEAGETNTLRAAWSTNAYTVVFYGNGGTNTMTAQGFAYNIEQALTLNRFVREGFTFAGWATDPTNDVTYGDGVTVANLTIIDGAVVPLYAKWMANGSAIDSELSKAIGCDSVNLTTNNFGWVIAPGEGKDGGNALRTNVGGFEYKDDDNEDNTHALNVLLVGKGVLTFRCKTVIAAEPVPEEGPPPGPKAASEFLFKKEGSRLAEDVILSKRSDSDWGEYVYRKMSDAAEAVYWELVMRNHYHPDDADRGPCGSDDDYALIDFVRWEPAVTNAMTVGVTFRDADGGVFSNATYVAGEAIGTLPVLKNGDGGDCVWTYGGSAVDAGWIVPAAADGAELLPSWGVVPPEHPVPEATDAVTISSAAVADGKFSLSFKSDAKFDYNLLTNANLLIDGWGIMETQVGDGNILTFEPLIIEGQPQLFYKVETIQRK